MIADLLWGWMAGAWQYIAAGVGAVVVFFAGRRQGKVKERNRAREADIEKANKIRDRVDFDLPDRVRKYDGAGYRDRK